MPHAVCIYMQVVEEWLLSWKHATVSGCFAEDHCFKYYRGTLSGSGLPMATRTGAREDPLLHVSVKVVRGWWLWVDCGG